MSPSPTASEALLADDQRPLTALECRRWLHRHHEGRLGYLSGSGQRSVVVSYTVADAQILLQVPDYNDIAQYAPGAAVTLAVDGTVEPTTASEPATREVRVSCTAASADDTTHLPTESLQFEESWPTDIQIRILSLPLTHVEGVQRRVDHRRADEFPGTS